jgi:CheY-like chemotaxis protein
MPSMGGKMVLVLEDDRTLQDSVRKLVERAGFKVVTARTLSEAQGLLERITRPCLILLDALMKEGIEAMTKLGAHYPLATIPVRISASNVRRISKKSVQLDVLRDLLEQHCGAQPTTSS